MASICLFKVSLLNPLFFLPHSYLITILVPSLYRANAAPIVVVGTHLDNIMKNSNSPSLWDPDLLLEKGFGEERGTKGGPPGRSATKMVSFASLPSFYFFPSHLFPATTIDSQRMAPKSARKSQKSSGDFPKC